MPMKSVSLHGRVVQRRSIGPAHLVQHMVGGPWAHGQIAADSARVAGLACNTMRLRRSPIRPPALVATRSTIARLPFESPESEIHPAESCVPKLALVADPVRVHEVESPVVMRCRVVELELLPHLSIDQYKDGQGGVGAVQWVWEVLFVFAAESEGGR